MDHILLKYKPRYLYETAALIASIFLALFTYLQPGMVLAPGLDSSWAYGINQTFERNLLLGRDIYFTFGPLGFLAHTAPYSLALMTITAYAWFAWSVLSYFLVFILCVKSARSSWSIVLNLLLAAVLVFYSNDHIQRLLIIAYASVFLHWYTDKRIYLFLISATAVCCFLIKFSYGITVLALLLPYLAIITVRDKRLTQAAFALACCIGLYMLGWALIYGQLTGALGYLKGGLEFSQGSVTAMAVNPYNNWYTIAAFYIAFIMGIDIVSRNHQQGWAIMPLCFLGPLFIWSKYAFGREDSGHLAFLMSYVFYIGLLWIIVADKIMQKLCCAAVVVICFFSWKDFSTRATTVAQFTPHLQFTQPDTFKNLWNQSGIAAMMKRESDKQLESLRLPAEIRDVVGESSVDIYPWESLIARINKLNWTPRPVYQSYITYTPFLDRKNLEFYQSTKAPEFIIWHYHSDQDIDNRYAFSSDPLTLQGLLTHYKREQCKGAFCVWRHQQQKQLSEKPRSATTAVAWNTWIDLPVDIEANVLRAHIKAQRTVLGKLNMALWKEGGIEIDYRLTNDEIKSHTLVLENAISGIWASPYTSEQISTIKAEAVEQQTVKKLLGAKRAEAYIEKADLTSQGLHVVGWGLVPFKNTQTQQSRLLLTSESGSYIVNTKNLSRPGITEYFGKSGIVDLNFSGLNETIDTDNIRPGKYQLHFVITNEGETAVHTQMPAIMLDIQKGSAKNIHNVSAIRLRTTRPWAFDETFTASWSGLTFHPE